MILQRGRGGVYGMAGLILELAQQYPGVRVRIVPGNYGTCAGAAVLSAADARFCCHQLKPTGLRPWKIYRNRVEAAAKSDFVICLYNPASKGLARHIFPSLPFACQPVTISNRLSTEVNAFMGWLKIFFYVGRENGVPHYPWAAGSLRGTVTGFRPFPFHMPKDIFKYPYL